MIAKKMMIISTLMSAMFGFNINANGSSVQIDDPIKVIGENNLLVENESENLSISRFVQKSDIKSDSVWDITLRKSWWSRPHEYAWAMQFAGPDLVVLDAACGISHPLKWYLADNCKETWACDTDPRIASKEAIIKETYDDLGEEAYSILISKDYIFDKITLIQASIFNLPDSMPLFDRIFCISTLEHLKPEERARTLENFAKVLAPNGWIVLTVDYPEVTPEELSLAAKNAGLVAVSTEEMGNPPVGTLNNGYYNIYRCVYKHAN